MTSSSQVAIARCKPRLVLFSGHSFAGSLAFELPNGRIELPPPELFIEQVRDAISPPSLTVRLLL